MPKLQKKHRKHGRNKKWCEGYARTNQRENNKAKKLLKHLRKFPDDACAIAALKELGVEEPSGSS